MQVPIQLYHKGRQLLGMIHVPMRRSKGSPIVLMNYGLNGDRVDNHRLSVLFARQANEAGIAVVRFDYSGCGVSTEEFWETSLAEKTSDTLAVIDFIKGCFPDEDFNLILLGYSDGIRVLNKIARLRDEVQALCLWNPIIRSMTGTFKSSGKKMAIEPITKKLLFPLFGLYMGIDYLKEANEDMMIEEVLDIHLPKLFVFGTGDTHTLQLQQELKSMTLPQDLQIEEVAEANHLFNRVEWSEQVVQLTIDWVNALSDKKLMYGNSIAK